MTLDKRLDGRENFLTPVRLLLALTVALGHSLMVSGSPLDEPLIGGLAPSWLAVNGFFILSGFLIARSVQQRDLVYYAVSRILRLYPALIAVLAVGAAFTAALHLGRADMPSHPGSWLFPFGALSFLDPLGAFPGLFAGNPKGAFDGPLWTLRYEALAYLGLPLVFFAGWLIRPARIWALWGALALGWAGLTLIPGGPETLHSGARFAMAFMLGAAIHASAGRIRLDGRELAAALGVAAILYPTPFFEAGANLVLAWALLRLGFARAPRLAGLARLPDWSYGLYIWHWPVYQTLKMIAPEAGPVLLLAAGLPVAWLFAAASWSFVERPALAMKRPVAEGLRAALGRAPGLKSGRTRV